MGKFSAILVVDDIPENRELLCRRLRKRYPQVLVEFENGREALAALDTHDVDLVLLDIMMPEVDGITVLQTMRANEAFGNIPVIVISAADDVENVVTCLQLGAHDFLPKPFVPEILKARVDASLERKRFRDQERAYLRRIEEEKRRADQLLHVIFPDVVVRELKEKNRVEPRRYENVAVLFADVVGFTSYCSDRPPDEILEHLQEMVFAFESAAQNHALLKIKTVGDCFMATAGLLQTVESPVDACVQCGVEMLSAISRIEWGWNVRVGIHVGPVIAGIVGHRQYLFDVWGDTVNTASRIESLGRPGFVNLSMEAWSQVSADYRGKSLGVVSVKGKGDMELMAIEGIS